MEYLDRITKLPRPQSGTDVAESLTCGRTGVATVSKARSAEGLGLGKGGYSTDLDEMDWNEVISEDAKMDR